MTSGPPARAPTPEDSGRTPAAGVNGAPAKRPAKGARANRTGQVAFQPAEERALAEQRFRHTMEHNELLHARECETLAQQTAQLRTAGEEGRRTRRTAARVTRVLMWVACLASIVIAALLIAWLLLHIGTTPKIRGVLPREVAGGLVVSGGPFALAVRWVRRSRARRRSRAQGEAGRRGRRPSHPSAPPRSARRTSQRSVQD